MPADKSDPRVTSAPELPSCDGARAAAAGCYSPRLYSFGKVHCAVNYALANVSLLEVQGGYVLFDTGHSLAAARAIKQAFAAQLRGSPQAIVYTHSHPDHTQGAAEFHQPGVEIWAQSEFAPYQLHEHRLTRAYVNRGAKQFGFALDDALVTTNGIGPPLRFDPGQVPPVLFPTRTFDDFASVTWGGVEVHLHRAPGETLDHLFAWLPAERVLLAGDNLYQAFPNLYAIRGVPPRPVDGWIRSLDAMRRLKPAPEHLLLGHTAPVSGAAAIQQLLTDYRDAIAYVHDSVLRLVNQGRSPDDLVREIRLPERLARHPYLQEVYGTVRSSVRGIYAGYMGWFDGRASHLDPLHPDDVARRLVPGLGGRAQVLTQLQEALAQGDLRWAAWLGEQLLALDAGDADARSAMAQAYERLAEQTTNPLERHWYLSDALQMRDQYQPPRQPRITSRAIAAVPMAHLLAVLPSRVDPAKSAQVRFMLSLDFTDTGQQFTFHIREGVGEIAPGLEPQADLTIRSTELDFKRSILTREVSPVSSAFWKNLSFEVPGPRALKPVRVLRELRRFASCMVPP